MVNPLISSQDSGIRILFIVLLFVYLIACFCSYSWAGNKQMVEKSVEELDELNKQAVQQIPDLPEKGYVDIKANVTYEKGSPVFDIYYNKITTEKEGNINFGSDQEGNSTEKRILEGNDDKDN